MFFTPYQESQSKLSTVSDVSQQSSQPSFLDPALVGFMKEGGSTASILFISFAGVCAVMYFMTKMLQIALTSKKK